MKNFIIIFFLTCNILLSQDIIQSKQIEITNYLENVKNDYNVSGMVVAITNKDEIEYIKSFGGVSINDNFIIGSNSKAFTSLIILRLQQKGLVNIDEPVVKYLPWFEYENKVVSNKIKIKDLLHHTSGQPTELGRIFPDEDENEENVRLEIVELLKGVKSDKYPIRKFDYSNSNYQLLGYVIEKITNKDYSTVLRLEITDLLKMNNTSTVIPDNLVQGYQPFLYYPIIPITPNYNKVDIPSGYINSNADDLSKYLRELMNSYNTDTTAIISKDISNELFKRNEENNMNYALGWFRNEYKDTEIFHHGGLTESFNSAFIIVPEIEKSIIVLSNNFGVNAEPTSLGILSILLNKEPTKRLHISYKIIRILPVLVLLLLIVFFVHFKKWIKNGKPLRVSKKLMPNLLLIIGIIIGLGWTFYAPSVIGATLITLFQFDIASAFSAVILTIFTLGISFSLYLNCEKKTLPNNV